MWHKIKGQHNLHPLTPHSPTTDRPLGKSITHMPCPWESYIFSPFSLSWSCLCRPSCWVWEMSLPIPNLSWPFQPTVTDRPPALGLSLPPMQGVAVPSMGPNTQTLCLNGHRVALSCQAAKHGSAPTRRQHSLGMLMTSSIPIFRFYSRHVVNPSPHNLLFPVKNACKGWQFVIKGFYYWNESTIHVFREIMRFQTTFREGLFTASSF